MRNLFLRSCICAICFTLATSCSKEVKTPSARTTASGKTSPATTTGTTTTAGQGETNQDQDNNGCGSSNSTSGSGTNY